MPLGRPVLDSLAAIPFFGGLDAGRARAPRGRDAHAAVPAGRGHLPHRRPGRCPVRHRQRRGEDLAAVGDRRRGHPRHPAARATCSASWRCSTARRGRASATALSATETVVLPRDRFRELIATEAGVRDALLASIAGELRRLTTHVEELHFLDITGRLAAQLVRLAREGGTRPPTGRPAPDHADPGRPGVDGRLHAPEREQAARPVHRRRPTPARARRHRRDRPRRPRQRPPAARRRVGAVAGAAQGPAASRPPRSAARLRPLAPPRKTSRRSRCSPAGVTTATDDRGVAARAARAHRQSDLGAAELHGPPREAPRSWAGRRVGPSSAPGRRPPRAVGARRRRRERLAEAQPRDVAEQRRELPARPDLDDGEAPAERRRAAAPIASDQVVVARRPDVLAERAPDDLGRRPPRRAPRRSRRRRRRPRPGRPPPRPGRRSRPPGSVGGAAPRRAIRRPAIRRCRSAGTSGRRRRRRARSRRRRGQDLVRHIGRISRGGPGSATTTRPSARAHQPARAPSRSGWAAPRPTGSARPA